MNSINTKEKSNKIDPTISKPIIKDKFTKSNSLLYERNRYDIADFNNINIIIKENQNNAIINRFLNKTKSSIF